jgi:hypothetical protein
LPDDRLKRADPDFAVHRHRHRNGPPLNHLLDDDVAASLADLLESVL